MRDYDDTHSLLCWFVIVASLRPGDTLHVFVSQSNGFLILGLRGFGIPAVLDAGQAIEDIGVKAGTALFSPGSRFFPIPNVTDPPIEIVPASVPQNLAQALGMS